MTRSGVGDDLRTFSIRPKVCRAPHHKSYLDTGATTSCQQFLSILPSFCNVAQFDPAAKAGLISADVFSCVRVRSASPEMIHVDITIGIDDIG